MIEERYQKIDKAFAAFDFRTIQSFFTILLLMDRNDISQDEMVEYKEEKRIRLSNNDKPVAMFCPLCKTPMAKSAVNISPGTITGDDSTVVYTCRNYKCMHQIFE